MSTFSHFNYTSVANNTGETSGISTDSGGTSCGGGVISTCSTACTACETGRPVATDPVTGQVICSCQYDASSRLNLSNYPRGCPAVGVSVGGSVGGSSSLTYATNAGYASSEHTPYPSIGVDSAAYFSQFANPYDLKSSVASETPVYGGISAGATYGYTPYEPPIYGYAAQYDLVARRKNATREATGTLKAWLNEHKKNPYPTKGEKIMLAIITKMTLTQVSTWFANARRRLKKENKMTWEPRNRTESDEETDKSSDAASKDLAQDASQDVVDSSKLSQQHVKTESVSPEDYNGKQAVLVECSDLQKPKIWSLADTAASKSPSVVGNETASVQYSSCYPGVAAADQPTSCPLPASIAGYGPRARFQPRPLPEYCSSASSRGAGATVDATAMIGTCPPDLTMHYSSQLATASCPAASVATPAQHQQRYPALSEVAMYVYPPPLSHAAAVPATTVNVAPHGDCAEYAASVQPLHAHHNIASHVHHPQL